MLVHHVYLSLTVLQGVPYDYIVGQENTALQHAPAVIQKALGRMIWAGRHHAKDTDFVPYNEVLALGYLQDGEIGVSVPSSVQQHSVELLLQSSGFWHCGLATTKTMLLSFACTSSY
jgi:hypothetical protein